MNRAAYVCLLLLIAGLALALRLPDLASRPMHNDEGVNAVKFNDLWTTGHFEYDPNEYHGPTLYYLTVPIAWLSGAKTFDEMTEVTFRLVPVIFGVGLILLLPLIADGIGRGGVIWAALFCAVSPAFVFYSRYYIHEMPLVFFAFAAIACGWRYRRSNRLAWAAASGAFVGLTYATKETWVLALAAAAGAAVTAAVIWHVLLKGPGHRVHLRSRALGVGAVSFAVVFVTLFSGFFTDWSGPSKAIAAYFHYTGRASGGVHDKPWDYYVGLLTYWRVNPSGSLTTTSKGTVNAAPIWTEAATVALAVVGLALAVFRRHHAGHHVAAAPAASRGRGEGPHPTLSHERTRGGREGASRPLAGEGERGEYRPDPRQPRSPAPAGEGAGRRHPADPPIRNPQSAIRNSPAPLATRNAQLATPHAPFTAYPPFVRFLGFYTLFLTVAFSAIPYKTPWCALGFLHGMTLLAGFACGQLVHLAPHWLLKIPVAAIFLAAAAQLAWQADRATNNFAAGNPKRRHYFEASRYNPYVYAHTGTDIFNLVKRVEEVASVSPRGDGLIVDVVTTDCWPVPFYLRKFPHVRYPRDVVDYWKAPDVVIGTADDGERLSGADANPKYVPSSFGLRPAVVLWVYVREDLWDKLRAKWK
jgi:predicted membrane-bound mannosyltransferase